MLQRTATASPRTSLGKHLPWRVLANGRLRAAFFCEDEARRFLDAMQELENCAQWLIYFEGPHDKGY
jgi:hypothetical protein